jgi:hypothetical protein
MAFIGLTASASGGRYQPNKPVVTHTATGVFTVSSYATNIAVVDYTISATGPAGYTNNSGAITLNNTDSVGSIYATAKKPGPASTTATFERKAYSYYFGYTGQYSYTCNCSPNQNATCNTAPPCPNGGCGCYDGAQNRCICWAYGPPYCQSCTGQSQGPILNTAPASAVPPYTNEYSEWVRLG